MKRIIAALLAALLLTLSAALAETTDEEFGFVFDDEGYTGEWVSIGLLSMEFCLPDGWIETESELDAVFSAVSADASVHLDISIEDEEVASLAAWADENLESYDSDEAGLYDVLVEENEAQLVVRLVNVNLQLIEFRFDRDSQSALSRDYALEIVGSASEDWFDEEIPFDEDEDANDVLAEEFDFDGE